MENTVRFVQAVNDVIINPILALIFTAALFLFLYGGFMFVVSAGNESARVEGRSHMLWGILGMVIMVSVFAILNIGLATFGARDSLNPDVRDQLDGVQIQGVQGRG